MRKWAHPPGELMAAHVSRPLTPTGYGRASPACTTESLMLTMSYPRCYRCVSWVLWAPSIGLTLLRKSALPGVYYFRGGLLFCSVGRLARRPRIVPSSAERPRTPAPARGPVSRGSGAARSPRAACASTRPRGCVWCEGVGGVCCLGVVASRLCWAASRTSVSRRRGTGYARLYITHRTHLLRRAEDPRMPDAWLSDRYRPGVRAGVVSRRRPKMFFFFKEEGRRRCGC
jgi:hypothetical protein